jgi:hypothetical protein
MCTPSDAGLGYAAQGMAGDYSRQPCRQLSEVDLLTGAVKGAQVVERHSVSPKT